MAIELAKRAGFAIDFVVMPRARIWKKLEDGSLMATGSAIETAARDKFGWYIMYITQKYVGPDYNYLLIKK